MRIDHIAYRVANRDAAVKFFKEAFGYREQAEFDIKLEDGSGAKCMSLEPPEKSLGMPFSVQEGNGIYHLAPEIFVSSGEPGGVIDRWVKERGHGVGGIHHIAYEVQNVDEKMREWLDKGWAFTTNDSLKCDDLTQVFSRPNAWTNVIYEFIERKGQHGFCQKNVAALMQSTASIGKEDEEKDEKPQDSPSEG